METMLFEGAVELAGLGLVRLYFSSLSVGFLVAQFDIADGVAVDLDTGAGQDDFKATSRRWTAAVAPLVAEWSSPRCGPCVQSGPGSAAVRHGRRHAAVVAPARGRPAGRVRVHGAPVLRGQRRARRERPLRRRERFTNVYGQAGALVDHAVEGLMVATQEWLIVDEAQRLLAEHLVRLSQTGSGDLVSVDSQYAELLLLTQEVTLQKLILSEEQRYLANTRTKVKDAATELLAPGRAGRRAGGPDHRAARPLRAASGTDHQRPRRAPQPAGLRHHRDHPGPVGLGLVRLPDRARTTRVSSAAPHDRLCRTRADRGRVARPPRGNSSCTAAVCAPPDAGCQAHPWPPAHGSLPDSARPRRGRLPKPRRSRRMRPSRDAGQ